MTYLKKISSQMNVPVDRAVDFVLQKQHPSWPLIIGVIFFGVSFTLLSLSTEVFLFGLFLFQSLIWGIIGFLVSRIFLNTNAEATWTSLFAVVFLYCLFWIPLGFDVTDEGRRLSFSYFLFVDGNESFVDFKFGSSLINWLWLHLIPGPSIVWSRIGFAFVQGGISALTFSILAKYFSSRTSSLMTLAASFVALTYVVQSINYNNTPVLLSLASLYFLLDKSQSIRSQFLAGIFISLAALAKLPFVVLVPIALAFCFWRNGAKGGFRMLISASLVVLLFLAYLWSSNNVDQYQTRIVEYVIEPIVQNESNENLSVHQHDPQTLSKVYNKNLNYLLDRTWPLILSILILGLIVATRNYLLWILGAIGLFVLWWEWMSNDFYYYYFIGVTLSLVLIYLPTSIRKHHQTLLAASVLLALISFSGSNTGIRNIVTSGAIILPMAFVYCGIFESRRLGTTGHALVRSISLVLAIISVSYKNDTIYRDSPRSSMTASFESNGLRGIYSTPERVAVTDELLSFAEENEIIGESLLCINTTPMFYYLLETAPGELLFWKLPNQTASQKDEFFNGALAPTYIVNANINVRDRQWPSTEYKAVPQDLKFLDYYEEMLNDPSGPYSEVFGNEAFSLYRKR